MPRSNMIRELTVLKASLILSGIAEEQDDCTWSNLVTVRMKG